MNLSSALKELREELRAVDEAIAALEKVQKRQSGRVRQANKGESNYTSGNAKKAPAPNKRL